MGYDLYVQLVAEAVAEARGEARPDPPTVSIDVPGDAHLPKDYVAAEDARLEAYRRLASAGTAADVDDIGVEWADRYGPLPAPAQGLLAVARLRASAHGARDRRVTMSSVRPGGTRQPAVRVSPGRARPPAPRCGCGGWHPVPPTARTWPSSWCRLPRGRLAADTIRGVIEELIPLGDAGPDGDTL